MGTSTATRIAFTDRILSAFVALSILGMVGLVVTAILGFEEPNDTLFMGSSLLLFAAPVAMLVHLTLTGELTREEKRVWLRLLTGRHAASAFSDYLTSHDRRATAKHTTESQRTQN